MSEMSDDPTRGPEAGPGRRVNTLVGAAVALALFVGGLTFLSPAFRDQLVSSFTRRPAGYTELFFVAEAPVVLRAGPPVKPAAGPPAKPGAAKPVVGSPATGEVRFTIVSHELERTSYRYRVTVRTAAGGLLGETAAEVSLGSEESVQVKSVVPVSRQRPADAGIVTVSLDGRPEHLSYLLPAPGRTQ